MPVSTGMAEQHGGPAADPHAAAYQRGPLGTVYQYPSAYQATSDQGLSTGEKQALVAGFFVMASLAIAIAVGWWATPPTAPTVASNEQRRPQTQAIRPAGEKEFASGTSGNAGMQAAGTKGQEETRSPSRFAEGEVDEKNTIKPAASASAASALGTSPSPSEAAQETPETQEASIREDEMRRLKAQAYSETQKDRLGTAPSSSSSRNEESPSPASPARSPRPSKANLSQAVADCDNEIGLFYRERCKWRLCNGRWGKDGCPSYQNDARSSARMG